jgi:hypothetical protein
MMLKRFKIGKAELCLLVLVLAALILRFVLISQNWPTTNSDEATIDLMALHILTRGEHPIFFYGQAYMGSFEAYVGALCFQLFGVSLFSLRLGLLPLVALFLVSMYALTSLLYNKRLALLVVALLAIGPGDSILHQFKAIGGYPEVLLLGALIFLLSSYLVLSRSRMQSEGRKRLWTYALLGLLIGFSLYTDPLNLPFIATSLLMLLLFCYRELRAWPSLLNKKGGSGVTSEGTTEDGDRIERAVSRGPTAGIHEAAGEGHGQDSSTIGYRSWAGPLLILGIFIGLLPFFIYNLQHIHGYTTFNAYIDIQNAGKQEMQREHIPPIRMLLGGLLITLPLALGVTPACSANVMPFFGPTTANTTTCVLWHGSWTLGYWLLWLLSTVLTIRTLWTTWQAKKQFLLLIEDSQSARLILRLLLLLSTACCFLLYILNPQSALAPAPTTRYLICMLIGTPALLWPLWQPFESSLRPRHPIVHYLPYALILLLIGSAITASTATIFFSFPGTAAFYQQQDGLIADLQTLHATRIYTDYWTCNRIIFRSNEQILCNTLNEQLTPGQDRYPPYHQEVNAVPDPGYAFQTNSPQAKLLEQLLHQQKILYKRSISNGYVIYQPASRVQLP